jgi:hypothetical protein
MTSEAPSPRLLNIKAAAAYLSLSPTTLRKLGPKPVRVGRKVLYHLNHLNKWADGLANALDISAEGEELSEVERRFFEERGATR